MRVSINEFPPTKTKQAHKEECDINVILKKFQQTGIAPQNSATPRYGDFSDVEDYQSALHAVMNANESFMALPSSIRKRFDNDPTNLLAFLSNPKNLDEAITLGLIEKPATEAPMASHPTSETSTPAPKAEKVK
jgi:phage internal scaffolding protein